MLCRSGFLSIQQPADLPIYPPDMAQKPPLAAEPRHHPGTLISQPSFLLLP